MDIETSEEHGPWPAFADLLAATTLLFLVFFIVMLVPQFQSKQSIQSKLGEIERELRDLERDSSVGIHVSRTQSYVRVTIEEETTFPRNEWELVYLREEGKEALRRLAERMTDRGIVDDVDQIQVVGHASRDGSSRRNWVVSAGRAAMVALFLTDSLKLPPCKVTALGRSANFPLAPLPDDERLYDAEAARRIELEIHPEVPTSDQLYCNPYRDQANR